MMKRALPVAALLLPAFLISCDSVNLLKAAYTSLFTTVPVSHDPLSFAIVLQEGARLNLGAIKGGDPVNLTLYFFDASNTAFDVTADAVWAADPVSVASFDDPLNFNGRLTLNAPGDVVITATYQAYPSVSALVHINGPAS